MTFSGGKVQASTAGTISLFLTLAAPEENMGKIFIQEVEIRVTKGCEIRTYLKLSEFSWADRS